MKWKLKLVLALALSLIGSNIYAQDSSDVEDSVMVHRIHVVREIESVYLTYTTANRAHQYAWLTVTNAEDNDLPPLLIAAVAIEESRMNPRALGKAKEISLMQINPRVWKGRFPDCGKNLWLPKVNFCYGARILDIQGIEGYNGRSKINGPIYTTKIYSRLGKLYMLLHTFYHDYI